MNEDTPNNNPRMSAELIEFETAIRKIGLPSSAISQHELMYQAGWQAAMDAQTEREPTSTRRSASFWKLTTFLASAVSIALAGWITIQTNTGDRPLALKGLDPSPSSMEASQRMEPKAVRSPSETAIPIKQQTPNADSATLPWHRIPDGSLLAARIQSANIDAQSPPLKTGRSFENRNPVDRGFGRFSLLGELLAAEIN
ncbi:MAG: hypothetical protein AAFN77_06695 [Planctomycetota bacterium]